MNRAAVSSFELEWPALAGRLHAMLARKSLPPWKRDDIVQETGLRLFRMWDEVDAERSPWGLVVTIALNLLRDEARRRPDREVLGAVPEIASGYDVERAGIARLELRRVHKAMGMLSPDHRSVLMSELGEAGEWTQRGRDATKMLRMRARRKLTSLLETASVGSAALILKGRRLLGLDGMWLLRGAGGSGDQGAKSLAAGMVAILGLFSVPIDPADVIGPRAGTSHGSGVARMVGTAGIGSASSLAWVTAGTGTGTHTRAGANARARDIENKGHSSTGGGGTVGGRTPLRVPLPVGDGYVEIGAYVDLGVVGAEVGDHGGEPPVCTRTGFATVFQCAEPPPGSKAGVTAAVKVGTITAGVTQEVH